MANKNYYTYGITSRWIDKGNGLYELQIACPGLDKKGISITQEGNDLLIRKPATAFDNSELFKGKFLEPFIIHDVEYVNGILVITIEKALPVKKSIYIK